MNITDKTYLKSRNKIEYKLLSYITKTLNLNPKDFKIKKAKRKDKPSMLMSSIPIITNVYKFLKNNYNLPELTISTSYYSDTKKLLRRSHTEYNVLHLQINNTVQDPQDILTLLRIKNSI